MDWHHLRGNNQINIATEIGISDEQGELAVHCCGRDGSVLGHCCIPYAAGVKGRQTVQWTIIVGGLRMYQFL